MIIPRLSSGLGNQLFQYALGRNLAIENKTDFKLDISFFPNDIRKYALGGFNIVENFSTKEDLAKIGLPNMEKQDILSRTKRKIFRLRENHKPINERKIIIEPYFQFCPDILKIKNSCYLSGNWQSEKYFKDSGDIIKKEFTLKNEMSSLGKEWVKRIEKNGSVSLHIRRGDYVNNLQTNQLHGTCDIAYYQRAINAIIKKINNPGFFIFSDDIEWAKNNLRINYPIYFVSDKTISDYEELIIMSKCKHNIIANSSFSWWGAWLNDWQDKIVIVPDKWFNTPIDTKDLIPESWIKI
jgi:hypothetical protein